MIALMYHDVVPPGAEDMSGFRGRDARRYKVTPERFEAHLRTLVNVASPALPAPRRLALTFDDGGRSALTAATTLERYGLRGHFFVTVNYIGASGFLDEAAIRDLSQRGHVIGTHSCSHPLRMGHSAWSQLVDEWTRSRATLSDILGADVSVGSVPGGDFAPRVAQAAAVAGIRQLFTSEPTCAARSAFGVTLNGRYTIGRWTSATTVGQLIEGSSLPWIRQTCVWNLKKTGKSLAGRQYLRLRKFLLRHGDEVCWGDRDARTG